MRIRGVSTTSQFELRCDLAQFEALTPNYQLNIEEQFTGVDYDEINEWLCIYTGTLSSDERLLVYVSTEPAPLMTLSAANSSSWNNVSVSSYLSSTTLTIRFEAENEVGDTIQSSWQIDCVLLHTWSLESKIMEISLYNYGKIDMTVSSVFVDGILPPPPPPEPIQIAIGGHKSTTVLPTGGGWTSGKTYHLKLVTDRGSAFEGDFVAP
jgi:hypothetical protein